MSERRGPEMMQDRLENLKQLGKMILEEKVTNIKYFYKTLVQKKKISEHSYTNEIMETIR